MKLVQLKKNARANTHTLWHDSDIGSDIYLGSKRAPLYTRPQRRTTREMLLYCSTGRKRGYIYAYTYSCACESSLRTPKLKLASSILV